MQDTARALPPVWKIPVLGWITLILASGLLGLIFFDGLALMVHQWSNSEEYGYGFLIPVITLFLIWQKRDQIEVAPFSGTWAGFVVVLFGLMLFMAGELSTLYVIVQYSFLIVIFGLVLAFVGWRSFRQIRVPLLLLFFMIPLPNFIYQGLSAQLQLISSELGVAVIHAFGISVYLEGNVIDLGKYKLQVAEACNGLRYLFPLASLAFICAYLFQAPLWKRITLFLSSIPITILMNSFRIGAIGVLVEYWGVSMAEGFLHDFEGWAVFMACTLILVLEMWLLTAFGRNRKPFREVFGLELPAPRPAEVEFRHHKTATPFLAAVAMLVLTALFVGLHDRREEVAPVRRAFSEFPEVINDWQGRKGKMEQIYLDVLKLDDYILADFKNSAGAGLNFYVAYYASQRKGESAHSPRSCIPGGGWQIKELTQYTLDGVVIGGVPLRVNRVVIKKGDYAQLVYYWFQQRGRVITNEYLVKWYLFWDALTRNRTDGAMVRLIAGVPPGQDISKVDELLSDFAREMSEPLREFVPD